jgi:hypothetical protein
MNTNGVTASLTWLHGAMVIACCEPLLKSGASGQPVLPSFDIYVVTQ